MLQSLIRTLVLSCTVLAGSNPVSSDPLATLTPYKSADPYTIDAGDWSKVKIWVKSLTGKQSLDPLAVVFLLDYSGSIQAERSAMESAAIKLIQHMTPLVDKVGIVAFSETSKTDVVVPMTSDFSLISSKMAALTLGGSTDMQTGFTKANAMFAGITTPYRIVIMMTDGKPYPNGNSQALAIKAAVPSVANSGIKYCTVGLGANVDTALLKAIATGTNGIFESAPTSQALNAIFQKCLKELASQNDATNIVISEVLGPDMTLRPGSVSMPSLPDFQTDLLKFQTDVAKAKVAFEKTGKLNLPMIERLLHEQNYTVMFDVTVNHCGDTAKTYQIDDPSSHVSYLRGKGVKKTVFFPAKTLTVNPCSFLCKSTFDPQKNEVTITLVNQFSRRVDDVELLDITSKNFTIGASQNPPATSLPEPRVANWKLGSIEPWQEKKVTYQIEHQVATPPMSAPFDIRHPTDPFCAYSKDEKLTTVPNTSPDFFTLETALTGANIPVALAGKIKALTGETVNDAGMVIAFLSVIGAPPPEYGWSIPTKTGEPLLVKKTKEEITFFQNRRTWTELDPLATSANYTP